MIFKFCTAAFFMVAIAAFGQTNSTSGNCSPIVTAPKGDVTIRCESAGMTKDQADQQAREYAEILNKIRQENLNFRAVIDRLDSIKNDVGEIKKAVAVRRLTSDQRKSLLSVLKSAGHGDIYVFVPLDGGPEISKFAMDFVAVEKEAGYGGVDNGYGFGSLGGMTGLQMNFNPEDVKGKRIPKSCSDFAAAIDKYVEPILLNYTALPNMATPSQGTCWLLIAFKD